MATQQEEEQQQGAPDVEPEQKPLEVDLTEDPDAGDDDKGGDDRPSKKERREQFRQGALKEAQEAKAESARLARELAELRGQMTGMGAALQQRQQPPTADPLEAQIEGVSEQMQGILSQLRALDPNDHATSKDLQSRFRKLERQRLGLAAQAEMRQTQPQQISQEDIDSRILAAEFPDVIGDPEKRTRAQAEMIALMRQGKPYGLATAREAAQKVRGPQRRVPAVNEADKAKFTGTPSQAGAGGGNKFSPSRLQLSSARAYTAHRADLSDEDRVRIWAKEVGKKHGLI